MKRREARQLENARTQALKIPEPAMAATGRVHSRRAQKYAQILDLVRPLSSASSKIAFLPQRGLQPSELL